VLSPVFILTTKGNREDEEPRNRSAKMRVMCVNAITRIVLIEECYVDAVTRMSWNVSITFVVRLLCFPLFLVKVRTCVARFCSRKCIMIFCLHICIINRHWSVNIWV